ncbi:conserved hypothetical protein [delta proteobacterium NaphS2]|nr:conserved hypothetical protein [delta proteobacterium NaphS2]
MDIAIFILISEGVIRRFFRENNHAVFDKWEPFSLMFLLIHLIPP